MRAGGGNCVTGSAPGPGAALSVSQTGSLTLLGAWAPAIQQKGEDDLRPGPVAYLECLPT